MKEFYNIICDASSKTSLHMFEFNILFNVKLMEIN